MPKKKTEKLPSEHEIQAEYFKWVREKAVTDWFYRRIFSIPNGASTPYMKLQKEGSQKAIYVSPARGKLIKEGMRAGVWDVLIDLPVEFYPKVYRRSCWLEFKDEKGQLSEAQKLFEQEIVATGSVGHLVRSVLEAKTLTEHWMENVRLP